MGSHQGPQPQILTPAREVERFTESPKPLDPVSASHYNSRVLDITPKQPASPPLWFLLLVAALNGAAILILQIVGGKLLAPYLGSSHYVWTAQILVTMVALVVGYEFGGRMSDRQRSLTWLFGSMGAAAVWLALVLPFTEPIAFYALRWNLAIASLVAGGVLFFVPLLLLAITGPFLLRSLPVTQNNVGRQAGSLSAVSTLGSVGGALLAGLVLVPNLQNVVALHLIASGLTLLSVVYFAAWNRGALRVAGAMVVALVVCWGGALGIRGQTRATFKHWTELERRNSPFGLMQVIQSKTTPQIALLNDFLMQNSCDATNGQSLLAFSYLEHGLARAYHTNITSVLVVGMGVGFVPTAFAKDGAQVTAVEINPEYVDLGRKHFFLDTNLFQIVIGDGRHFLHRTTNRYDAVILDAFLGDSPPSHLMTRETFESVRSVLTEGGVFLMNSFGDFELTPDDFFLASMEKTLGSVFRSVRMHSTSNGNVILVASMAETLQMVRAPSLARVHPFKMKEVRTGFDSLITTDPSHGMILTDDFNPVDVRDARNRELIRRSMAEAVKGF